jgi:serpin B
MFIREKLQQDKIISDRANRIFDNIKEEFKVENNEKKVIKISLKNFLAIAASFVLILFLGIGLYTNKLNGEEPNELIKINETQTETKQAFKYALKSNSLEDFDLRFLQLENEKKNKIYSPLSIKYTLAMLNEGTEGESKEQISNLIGEYKPNKYVNIKNMSFANALFIRDSYKESIKENFVTSLRNKYNADVECDSFNSADKMNSWISNKTLGLIDNMIDDSSLSDLNFVLVNTLAIDMEWEEKFLERNYAETDYKHEKYRWAAPANLLSNKFEGVENEISGMGIVASINNYNIVNELGEENIRKTVGDEFRNYLNEASEWEKSYYLEGGKDVETAVKEYVDEYIDEIDRNYKRVDNNTDFYMYEDKEVKAFAKDLKEYSGTTLQYVAIMPEENLDKYIANINAEKVKKVIDNLKDLKNKNFKEGVITQIVGYIPKFKFDYDLELIQNLNDMGVKDVFDKDKANLKGITDDENSYIGQAMHKANIEFTQDGIKASAATFIGGAGAGEMFDYYYDVPVETIDLTFDKPYMFIVRDKKTGEVWFAGTVYEPWSIEDEPEINNEFGGVGKYSEFLEQFERIETETSIDEEVTKAINNSNYKKAYIDKLDSIKIDNNYNVEYYLTDIDRNAIPELMIETYTCEADRKIEVYTYNNNNIVYLGCFGSSQMVFYKMNNKDYILGVYGHMGYEQTYKIYINNNSIQKEMLGNEREISQNEGYTEGDILLEKTSYSQKHLIENYN